MVVIWLHFNFCIFSECGNFQVRHRNLSTHSVNISTSMLNHLSWVDYKIYMSESIYFLHKLSGSNILLLLIKIQIMASNKLTLYLPKTYFAFSLTCLFKQNHLSLCWVLSHVSYSHNKTATEWHDTVITERPSN